MDPAQRREQQRQRATLHLQAYVRQATDLDLAEAILSVHQQALPVETLSQVQVHAVLLFAQARHAELARQQDARLDARLRSMSREEQLEEARAWLQ